MFNRLSVILLHLFCISFLNAEPLVTLSQGKLNGTIQNSRNGKKCSVFLGIPYCKSPTGNLRFKNPVPADNWNGIRQATTFGNVCPQLKNGKVIGNEDCLFLNVYSPLLKFNSLLMEKNKSNSLLPVMVWIHGGSFMDGSSNIYPGNYLLDNYIILVTINYRLNILGFLSTGDSAAPGNFGMKDQVQALKWVQNNIRAFGGDSKRVTLFGESAGGASVALHALSKASNGLFHQYIIQSGSPLCVWAYTKRSSMIEYSRKIAPLLSCALNTTDRFVNCLRKRSVDSLLSTKSIFSKLAEFAQIWWTPTDEPAADGSFLTDSPKNLINQNQMKDLPYITGEVTDEGLVNTAILYADASLYSFVRSNLDQIIPYMAGDFFNAKNGKGFIKAVKEFYFNNSIDFSNKDKFIGSLTNYISDASFLYPEIKMLEKPASKWKSSIYFYSFGYRGTISIWSSIEKNRNLGVSHGDEVLYLFPFSSSALGVPNLTFTKKDILVSELMVDLWTSFAITSVPTSKQLKTVNYWVPHNFKALDPIGLQIGNILNNTDPTVSQSYSYYTSRMNFWRKNASV